MRTASALVCSFALLAPLACTSGGDALGECGEEAVQFCADRVDDDCAGGDEACPATQPADAPPAFECAANPPDSVLAFAELGGNAQVEWACAFVYQGETGAYYAAISVVDGADPWGPPGVSRGQCAYDRSARKHLFFTEAPATDCPSVEYTYPDELSNQLLSNGCRRMVRNLAQDDPDFAPDVQFLPGDEAAQRARLERFSVAEIACIGINNTTGQPYRQDEVFVTQAQAPFVMNAGFAVR